MATSGWLQEMRRAAEATHRTTPPAAISRQEDARDVATAHTTPAQAAQAETVEMCNQPAKTAQGASQSATRRSQREFTAPTDATRDYRAMYAALFRFHERHSPPTLGDDDGESYWAMTTEDMQTTAQRFNNDPFMMELLCVVFDELESEYKAMRYQTAGA